MLKAMPSEAKPSIKPPLAIWAETAIVPLRDQPCAPACIDLGMREGPRQVERGTHS
jgi:hypothetical protein